MPTRIPRTIPEFNAYIAITDDYLNGASAEPPFMPTWQRLGLSQQDADQWHALRQQWTDDLYAKYTNPVTKSKTVNAAVAEAIDSFRYFAQPLLRRMATSFSATVADAAVFNFKIGRARPSRMRTPINEKCMIALRSLGGGRVKFAFRTAHESGPPARPPEANCIIIAYKVGGDAPAHPDDGTCTEIISRASGVKDIGVEHRGQRLYLFARWYNLRYPHFAGPWSAMASEWL